MTTLTTNIQTPNGKPGIFSRIASALSRGIEAHGRQASRRDAIEMLEAKSDSELARMGLRREDIPHHVFRDLYYI